MNRTDNEGSLIQIKIFLYPIGSALFCQDK
jgi:hypothetical protein